MAISCPGIAELLGCFWQRVTVGAVAAVRRTKAVIRIPVVCAVVAVAVVAVVVVVVVSIARLLLLRMVKAAVISVLAISLFEELTHLLSAGHLVSLADVLGVLFS